MGVVVNLSERRRDRGPAAAPPAEGATIHLFLGVRYERHDDGPSKVGKREPTTGGTRRSRKRA